MLCFLCSESAKLKKCPSCNTVVCTSCVDAGFFPNRCTLCLPLRKTRSEKLPDDLSARIQEYKLDVVLFNSLHDDKEKSECMERIMAKMDDLMHVWFSNHTGTRKARCVMAYKMNEVATCPKPVYQHLIRDANRLSMKLRWARVPARVGIQLVDC